MSQDQFRELSPKEQKEVTEALIAWFRSQDLSPYQAVPIMCNAIVVANISLMKNANRPLKDAVEGTNIASKMLLQRMMDALEGKGVFKRPKPPKDPKKNS